MSALNNLRGLLSVATVACVICRATALHAPTNHSNLGPGAPSPAAGPLIADPDFHTIGEFLSGFIEHAVATSPLNSTLTAIGEVFDEGSTGRSAAPAYLASFVKIVWQFVNGIAKPFLKTYLVPIQMLFTYMAPKMFLRDCFNVDTTALLTGRTLSPFTIQAGAQAFFTCAVDIIAQVILCVKLLANMAPSIF